MCQFISWIKRGNSILFLTDEEVYSEVGRERLKDVQDNDVVGHGAIRAFYWLGPNEGFQHENTEFWNKNNFPPEIAQYLKSPETLLNTWGRMLRGGAIDPRTARSIIENAPKSWKEGLPEICIDIISKDADYSYDALRDFKWLTKAQKDTLVEGVSKDVCYSHNALHDFKWLTKAQKDKLVEGVSKGARYSYYTLRDFKWLTKAQKEKLQIASKQYK